MLSKEKIYTERDDGFCGVCSEATLADWVMYDVKGNKTATPIHKKCIGKTPFILLYDSGKPIFLKEAQDAYLKLYNQLILKELREQADENAKELENYVI